VASGAEVVDPIGSGESQTKEAIQPPMTKVAVKSLEIIAFDRYNYPIISAPSARSH
jgi:hypothetical protein